MTELPKNIQDKLDLTLLDMLYKTEETKLFKTDTCSICNKFKEVNFIGLCWKCCNDEAVK